MDVGIANKIKELIGESSIQKWAKNHGLPKQTVHSWVKYGSMPVGANFDLLIKSTGMPKEWWLDGQGEPNFIKNQDSVPYQLEAIELSKDKNQLNQDSKPYESQAVELREAANINMALLEVAVLVVHRYYASEGVVVAPERMAKLIVAIYKYAAAKGSATPEELDQFLKLIV